MVCCPFTTIWVLNTSGGKNFSACVCACVCARARACVMKSIKQYNLAGCSADIIRRSGLGGTSLTRPQVAYLLSFVKFGSGIQVILRLWPQQFHWLQYLYYWWYGFMKCTVYMASGGITYTASFVPAFNFGSLLLFFHNKESTVKTISPMTAKDTLSPSM
jgi:hypothetical protein